ncbi:hypothetical protein [Muriicola soli]|uniref:Selenophosphate synthetase n=1 Tax=Muriicola soli TaxID=2507538 RepID=A0A411E770_9FLAO|nr:hypothetical protein [Muriicola soli]QBA63487.1 hypothetical protein EQY75_02325 [Muriicola soli]
MSVKSFVLPAFLLLVVACKSDKKADPVKEETIIEKVAKAHGIEEWNGVEEIRFTFNVDRDTMHFERHWKWDTKTHEVQGISRGDTIIYNRKAIDSLSQNADAAFINDKYWLLAPINIFWDRKNLTYNFEDKVLAPISNDSLSKLTVVYGSDGGYTPGDAYDFYLGEDYQIKEWVFRKSNSPEPSSTTTWEDYVDLNGLKISRMHKNKEGNFSLYFTNVEVID